MQKRLTLPQPAPALPVLDRAAVAQLLEDEESNEYALVCHNRGVEEIEPSAWVALSRTTSVAPKATGKGIAAQGSLGAGGGAGASPSPLLRSLDLSFNKLRTLAPRCLTPLAENLRELKLYSNRLGYASSSSSGDNGKNSPAGRLASSFGSSDNGGLDGSGLGQCRNLERLELHDNGLLAVPGACLSPKLKHLRLDRNRLTSLQGLSRCTSLVYLSVDGNQLHGLCADGDSNNSSNGGGGGGKGSSKKNSSSSGAGVAAAAWLGGCRALAFLSAADNELERLPKRALSGPIAGSLVELVLSHNCLTNNCLPGLAPLKDGLEVLRLDDNHLTSLALLPPLNRLTELLVSNNRLTATASAAGGSGSATATPGSGENSTVPDRTNACLASLAVACPLLEVLDLSDNRLNLADDGSDDDGRAAAATACVALFAVPLASCAELRELSVGGNPCCAGTPASVLPSRSNASASGGAAADNATTASTASVSKWWFALREALPQLHALDELDTGRRQVCALNLEGPPILEELAHSRSFAAVDKKSFGGGTSLNGISEAKSGGFDDGNDDSSSSDEERGGEAKSADLPRAEAKQESSRTQGGRRGRGVNDDEKQQQFKGGGDDDDEGVGSSRSRIGGSSTSVPNLRLYVPLTHDAKAGDNDNGSSVSSSGNGSMGQPLSMRTSSSNGPLSARGHAAASSALAFTPRGVTVGSTNTPRGGSSTPRGSGAGGGPSSRPVMRPMSARTGFGSGEVHVETLETVSAVAAAFRAKMGAVKGALRENRRTASSSAINNNSSSSGSGSSSSIDNESGSSRGFSFSRVDDDNTAQPKVQQNSNSGDVRRSGSRLGGYSSSLSKKASDDNDSSDDDDDDARLSSSSSISGVAGGAASTAALGGDNGDLNSRDSSGRVSRLLNGASSGRNGGRANDAEKDLELSTGLYEDLASCADPTDKFEFDRSSSDAPSAPAPFAVASEAAGSAAAPVSVHASAISRNSTANRAALATGSNAPLSGSSSSSLPSSSGSSISKGPRGLQQALGFASRRDGGGSSLGGSGNNHRQESLTASSAHPLDSSSLNSATLDNGSRHNGSYNKSNSSSSSGVSYGVFADKSPPPPPKLTKPWLLPNYAEQHRDQQHHYEEEAKEDSSGGAYSSSSSSSSRTTQAARIPVPVDLSLDLSMLQLSSSSTTSSALSARNGNKSSGILGSDNDADDTIAMPQPSPRFQTESTIAELHKRAGPQAAALQGGGGGGKSGAVLGGQNVPTATTKNSNNNKGSFKGFKIPAAARAELDRGSNSSNTRAAAGESVGSSRSGVSGSGTRALSDRTNSPPDA